MNDHWCCEPGLTHLEMVSGEYHIWKWYVFLINDKLFSDQFMHHLWIMVLEIQKKMDIFVSLQFIDVDTDTERQIVLKRHFESSMLSNRKASGCFKMAIHIPRSRANFSSKNRKRWQIGVQISKQQKPKITCGLRFHGYPVRL